MSDANDKGPAEPDEQNFPETLYFFPENEVTEAELRQVLASDDSDRRAWTCDILGSSSRRDARPLSQSAIHGRLAT